MKISILLSCLTTLVGSSLLSVIDESYKFNSLLDYGGTISLKWTPTEEHVTFKIEAKTKGYVGFGLSPDGRMVNSDILLAFFDDSGKPRILDMFAKGYGKPQLDSSQDYVLENASKNDTHIIFIFSRKWRTCDQNDIDLNKESNNIIWAVNDQNPVEKDGEFQFNYHGEKKGMKFLYLNSSIEFNRSAIVGAKVWEIKTDKATFINGSDTTYLCSIVKFPEVKEKHHIIAYEPVIQKKYLNNVHHIVLYECDVGENTKMFEKFTKMKGVVCYGPDYPWQWYKCISSTLAWALGSNGFNEPNHVGIPILPNRKYFYRLEAHFENVARQTDIHPKIDFKIYYTTKLRRYDSGYLTVGASTDQMTIIPPGQSNWKILSYYTDQFFDWNKSNLIDGGVKVYAVEHHTHLLGKQIIVQHIRNGTELEPLTQDLSYNFNFQNTLYLPEEKTILPGDQLLTTCVYDSSKLSKITLGGLKTYDEMCIVFIHYYPRNNLGQCLSHPSTKEYQNIYNIKNINRFAHLDTNKEKNTDFSKVISRPENMKKDTIEKLQKVILQGDYDITCVSNTDDGKSKVWTKTELSGNLFYKSLPKVKDCISKA